VLEARFYWWFSVNWVFGMKLELHCLETQPRGGRAAKVKKQVLCAKLDCRAARKLVLDWWKGPGLGLIGGGAWTGCGGFGGSWGLARWSGLGWGILRWLLVWSLDVLAGGAGLGEGP
jgi:hypothetical protein